MSSLTSKLPAMPKKLTPPVIAFLLAVGLFLLSGFFMAEGQGLGAMVVRGQNILRISAFLGIIAVGQTLVIISGGEGIDLSVGATVTLSAIVVGVISNKQDDLVLVAFAAALAVGAIIGLINGIGVTALRVHPLVMTLGMAGVIEGVMLAIYQGQVHGGSGPMMSRFISFPVVFGLSGAVIVWIVIALLVWVLLSRTRYGKNLYAVGINRETAFLSGVRVPLTVAMAYVMSGMFAALGGFMLLGFTQSVYFTLGDAYLFPSVAAVVIGGTTLAGGEGNYWGTMSGALVLIVLDSILTTIQLPQYVRQIILGLLLVSVIAAYGRVQALRQ